MTVHATITVLQHYLGARLDSGGRVKTVHNINWIDVPTKKDFPDLHIFSLRYLEKKLITIALKRFQCAVEYIICNHNRLVTFIYRFFIIFTE